MAPHSPTAASAQLMFSDGRDQALEVLSIGGREGDGELGVEGDASSSSSMEEERSIIPVTSSSFRAPYIDLNCVPELFNLNEDNDDEGMHDVIVFEHNDDEENSGTETFIFENIDNTSKRPLKGSLIGVTRRTLDEMLELYTDHGRQIGFSVRKGKNRRLESDKSTIVGKYYYCSCAGHKLKRDDDLHFVERKRKRKNITRTGCGAFMRVKLVEEDVFEVVDHQTVHNHEFVRTEFSHLLRSSRKIGEEMKNTIQVMKSSGLKPTQSYRYIAEEVGGTENVGHSLKDHLNLINRWKAKSIEGGDAENVYNMLQERESEEKAFFYKVKLDEEGRLSHIFWRDTIMWEDYEAYGDVVVFDTTYRTNKYNLICAPFVGINNHWRNVMFGCAFISDEKIESFEWIFQVFKKSMGGKCPTTIFTDQDHAISSAIEKVFPTTRHRLCIWHLHQKAVSKFANLKTDETFKCAFKKCLTGCVDENEFEDCWRNMVSKYNLHHNSWFTRLYEFRYKWCTGLNKDFFSAGILSSQRSEVTNNSIGLKAKKTTSLTEFFAIFGEIVKNWREREHQDDFQGMISKPDSTFLLTGILKHASEVYTLTCFRIFENQFKEAISMLFILVMVDNGVMVYDIMPHDKSYTRRVIFDCKRKLIACQCKKFEESGLLCSHCIWVLHMNSLDRIPDTYVCRRWTREAKLEPHGPYFNDIDKTDLKDSISWRNNISRKIYNIILKSQGKLEARKIVEEACTRMESEVNKLIVFLEKDDVQQGSTTSILDPARVVTKGRSQRKKGHFEKKQKKQTSASTSLSREMGSKTPNLHLL